MVWALLKLAGGWVWGLLAKVPWQVWAALALAAAFLIHGHREYKQGFATAEAQYTARERDRQLRAAIDRELTEKRFREQENRHAHALANLDRSYSAERQALEERARRDRDAARNGGIRLRVPGATCPGTATSESGPPAGPARSSDGPTAVELPRALTESLLDLANDADAVADQLRACQAVVRADRASQGSEP